MNDNIFQNEFDKIYENTYSNVLRYVNSKCNNFEDSFDIIQEIYVELFKVIKRKGINYFGDCQAFVIHLAKVQISKYYRKNKIKKILEFITDKINSIEQIPNDRKDLLSEAIDKDSLVKVWMFLKKKDKKTNIIFYYYYYLDKSIFEIAEDLKMSESAVKNKLYRTLNEIKNKFKKDGDK
ncbi:MAG: RNA polymerase sigma factor [Ignavibacteriales bacterium]